MFASSLKGSVGGYFPRIICAIHHPASGFDGRYPIALCLIVSLLESADIEFKE